MARFNVALNQEDNPPLLNAPINVSASGDNVLVAGVAGKVIRVERIFFLVNGAVTITFKDGAGNTLSGPMPFVANGSLVFDFSTQPWFTTSRGNGFVINLGLAIQVSGALYYTLT